MSIEQPIDALIGRLEPARVSALVQVSRRGIEPPPGVIAAVRNAVESILTAVATSEDSVILQLLDTPTIKDREALAKKMVSIAPAVQARGREASLLSRIQELEEQLASTKEELENTRTELQKEIDGLQAELDLGLQDEPDKADDDGGNNNDDEDEDRLIPGDDRLFITQLSWRLAVEFLMEWRKTTKDPEDAHAFVDWLFLRRLDRPGARSIFLVLRHSIDFGFDWIDPNTAVGTSTSEETRAMLQRATVIARTGNYDAERKTVVSVREPFMEHVVFSSDAWPAVVAALRVFSTDHWGARPIEFLRWLHADRKYRQLLALMSWGAPLNQDKLLEDVPDTGREYFERVVQLADDIYRRNEYDFVPVPLRYLRAQIKDALQVIDDELPQLHEKLSSEELQSTEVYKEALGRLRQMRKMLAIDWLTRLTPAALRSLVDESMVNDTTDNRAAVVSAFEKMLNTVAAENFVQPVRWLL